MQTHTHTHTQQVEFKALYWANNSVTVDRLQNWIQNQIRLNTGYRKGSEVTALTIWLMNKVKEYTGKRQQKVTMAGNSLRATCGQMTQSVKFYKENREGEESQV